ncbi:MAG: RNA polymerase factor sigma-70 [Planctomycetota bacterium]|nr:MAG: RNA polymerase factor sigma-70 [Planctomycetota bacterium]
MWPDEDETLALLRGAQRGDSAAVEGLLERHRDSLHRMIECRLHAGVARRIGASDIVQETLLTASRRLAEYLQNPSMPFHAWLRQLARDRLADVYRRQLAEKRDVSRERALDAGRESSYGAAAELRDDQLTPAAMMLRQELAARFRQAVAQLEETSREIILMRHAEQLTNSQAAEVLGLSEPAASMRYLRALRQLRAILGESAAHWLG